MRQHLINTALVLIVLLLLLVVVKLVTPIQFNLGYNSLVGYSEGLSPSRYESEAWHVKLKDPSAIAALTSALFAALLYFVSRQQMELLAQANTTASDALAEAKKASLEAKRSTDSYVEGERGRLIVAGAHYDPVTNQIHLGFKNIGRSPLIITADEHVTITDRHIAPFSKPEALGGRKVAVMSGELYATWSDKGTIGLVTIPAPEIDADKRVNVGSTVNLFLQGQIVYYSPIGDRYRLVYTMSFSNSKDNPRIYTHRIYVGADSDGVNDMYNREELLARKKFYYDQDTSIANPKNKDENQ